MFFFNVSVVLRKGFRFFILQQNVAKFSYTVVIIILTKCLLNGLQVLNECLCVVIVKLMFKSNDSCKYSFILLNCFFFPNLKEEIIIDY